MCCLYSIVIVLHFQLTKIAIGISSTWNYLPEKVMRYQNISQQFERGNRRRTHYFENAQFTFTESMTFYKYETLHVIYHEMQELNFIK